MSLWAPMTHDADDSEGRRDDHHGQGDAPIKRVGHRVAVVFGFFNVIVTFRHDRSSRSSGIGNPLKQKHPTERSGVQEPNTPDRSRTCNLRLRRPLLYPVELQAASGKFELLPGSFPLAWNVL